MVSKKKVPKKVKDPLEQALGDLDKKLSDAMSNMNINISFSSPNKLRDQHFDEYHKSEIRKLKSGKRGKKGKKR